MKNIKIIIPVVILILATTWGFFKLRSNKAKIDKKATQTETIITEIPVTVIPVANTKMPNELQLIGTFEARKELTVIAETQGRITRLFVQEGQQIKKGQTIAAINDATIMSQLETARASLAKARKDVERHQNLLNVGAISQTQFEDVTLGMRNQESNVTSIETQLEYTSARSPMDGIVKEIILEEGSFANPGMQIASIVDINRLNLVVKVDEKDIVKVNYAQNVRITTEVYPDVIFTAKVNQISVQADAARKYDIAIEMINTKEHPLKAGMYGTVRIPSSNGKPEMALTIPRKSVVGSLKQPQVYLAVDGKAKLINIEVGSTMEELVVVQSGLRENDKVITTGQINLEDGRAITVIDNTNSLTAKIQ